MRHMKAIGIKWGFTTIILISFLEIFQGIVISQIITISIIITGLTYLIGDLLILPTFNNLIASIIDFGLIFLGVWLLTGFFIGQTVSLVIASAVIAYILIFCEFLFHNYMHEKVLPKKRGILIPFPNMRYPKESTSDKK